MMKGVRSAVHASVFSAAALLLNGCGLFGGGPETAEEPPPQPQPQQEEVALAEYSWKGEAQSITLAQLESELEELPSYHKRKYTTQEGRANYLNLMAESRIVLERAKELGFESHPTVLHKTEQLRRRLLLEAVEKLEVEEKVVVTEEAVQAYYDANLEKYLLPERVQLLCLAVKDEEQAAGYLKEIQDGVRTLDEIVAELSEEGRNEGPGGRNNGDTGLIARNAYTGAEAFTDAAFALELGQMTQEVFSMEYGGEMYYMLFRLEKRAEPYQQTLEEVKERVERLVKSEMTEAREKAWAAELEQIAQLALYPERLPEPPLKDGEPIPSDEVVFAEIEMDAAAALAEWTWNGAQRLYTWGQLQAHFDALRPYRKSRYEGVEGWTALVKERALEELQVQEAEMLNLASSEKETAQIEEYRRQLMIEQVYEQEIAGKAKPTDERLMEYYEEHASEYIEPEKVQLTCVTLDDKEAADQLFAEIQKGRDIAEAAQTLSEAEKNLGPGGRSNGDTGFFSRKSFSSAEQFTEAAFSTEVGQIVPEVIVQPLGESATYYMIFRVENKTPERQQTFDEVRSTIEKAVEKIAREERLNEWLEELKERTGLVVYPERIPELPEPEAEEAPPEPAVEEAPPEPEPAS